MHGIPGKKRRISPSHPPPLLFEDFAGEEAWPNAAAG